MLTRALPLLVFLALPLTSCDSNEEVRLGGTYEGQTELTATTETRLFLSLPAVGSGETFSFTGVISEIEGGDAISAMDITGTGTYAHPDLTLIVEGEAAEGTVSDDRNTILLVAEAGDEPVVLTRLRLD